LAAGWSQLSGSVWQEIKSLVRVTRIDQPEAALVAPDQAFFLRENLKLRLLNARLALLSRQFDTAQGDLRDAQQALDRYFDKSARRVAGAIELLKQVTAQARLVSVPRPDATLAAIATAAAGR
jgi:uroporphyrin-3 C-methyltransferase